MDAIAHEFVIIKRRKYVAVPVKEYRKLMNSRPVLPAPDEGGDRDAVTFAEVAIARNIIRRREAAEFSQKVLAEKAGMRVETLNRVERGVVVPSIRTLTKIDAAVLRAGV